MSAGTTSREICARCGTAISERGAMRGVCPRCLLLGVLDEEHEGGSLGAASGDREKTERAVTFGAELPRNIAEPAPSTRLDRHLPMHATPTGHSSPPAAHEALGLLDADGEPTMTEVSPPPPIINGHRVLRPIGEGGMGIVYLGHHVQLDKPVAIKLLRAEYRRNAELVKRFFDEAHAAVAIGSQHIVDITDLGRLDDGTPYFIMEWLDGQNLKQLLAAEGPLEARRALRILSQVASAIGPAHQLRIVHRDLKPENIFLIRRPDNPEFVKVLDFGIAKLMGDDPRTRRTRTGTVVGTVDYMSPEQCRGRSDQIDHRADIYSIGVMLYQMVTGRLPFEGEAFGEVMEQHLISTPVAPSLRRPGIAAGVDNVVLKAMSKAPVDRQRSVEELVEELRGAVAGHRTAEVQTRVVPVQLAPVQLAPAVTQVLVTSPVRSRRAVMIAVIAVGLGIVGVAMLRMANRAPVPVPRVAQAVEVTAPVVIAAPSPEPENVADRPSAPPSKIETQGKKSSPKPTTRKPVPAAPDPPPTIVAVPAPPESVTVHVSEPSGLTVRVNGKQQHGKTPCDLRLEGDGPFDVEFSGTAIEPVTLHFDDLADVRRHESRLRRVDVTVEKRR